MRKIKQLIHEKKLQLKYAKPQTREKIKHELHVLMKLQELRKRVAA